MSQDFYNAVKSTIDWYAADIADELGVENRVDLDDRVNFESIQRDNKPAVLWQLGNFKEAPRNPLYQLIFGLGVMSSNDPGNYELTRLVAAQEKRLQVGTEIDVRDYSGYEMPTESLGFLYVYSVIVDQTQYDEMSNVRLINIEARAVSFT